MLIIAGKTCSGKNKLANELSERGWSRCVTYTTRPMRPGEVDGVDYNFCKQDMFDYLKCTGFLAETADYDASFGKCSYGSAKDSYDNADSKSFIILNPLGIMQIKQAGISTKVVYISADDTVLRQRANARGDDLSEVERRLKADNNDFSLMETWADLVIDGTCTTCSIADEVENWFREAGV